MATIGQDIQLREEFIAKFLGSMLSKPFLQNMAGTISYTHTYIYIGRLELGMGNEEG
jgi:hypothetical protein